MKVNLGIFLAASVALMGTACNPADSESSGEVAGLFGPTDGAKAKIADLTRQEGSLIIERGRFSEKLDEAEKAYLSLVAKKKRAAHVLDQNSQAMINPGTGTPAGELKTIEEVSDRDFNEAVKTINSLKIELQRIDNQLGVIDGKINTLTRQIEFRTIQSIRKHREAKQAKVEQLKRQLKDQEDNYEGYWRCLSFDNLKQGFMDSAPSSDAAAMVAAAKKVAERAQKCDSLSLQLVAKRAELNQGWEELAAANELLRKTLSGESRRGSTPPKGAPPVDAFAGCYKLTSGSPLFKTPDTTDAWGPNSKPNASGFLIGSGALVYIHKRESTGRLEATAKSGSFLGRRGFLPETIGRTKADGALCTPRVIP